MIGGFKVIDDTDMFVEVEVTQCFFDSIPNDIMILGGNEKFDYTLLANNAECELFNLPLDYDFIGINITTK